MNFRFVFAKGSFLFVALYLVGCSTLTKEQCRSADWYEYGRIDASHGRAESFLSEHQDACGEGAPNVAEYKRGWDEGLKEFCSPNSAFHIGSNGHPKPEYCPGSSQAAFDEKFIEGEKVWKLKQTLAELNSYFAKVEENERKEAANRSDFAQIVKLIQGPGVAELQYSNVVRGQRDAVKEEINRLEEPYPTPSMFKRSAEVERGQPQFGALIGSFVGFGSGHGIQSRYKQKGWWYTVGEIGSLFIPGGGAIIGFLGFKVWESQDLWNYNYQASLGYPAPKD